MFETWYPPPRGTGKTPDITATTHSSLSPGGPAAEDREVANRKEASLRQ